MSAHQWSIASAKAELSRVVGQAAKRPQVIANRGKPVAVVLGIDEYERLSKDTRARASYRALLELSAQLRNDGGVELDIPARRSRPDPFGRPR